MSLNSPRKLMMILVQTVVNNSSQHGVIWLATVRVSHRDGCNQTATRLSFQPACHEDRQLLAPRQLNGHSLLKLPWPQCVSQPAAPAPRPKKKNVLRQHFRLLTWFQRRFKVTDHQQSEDLIGETGRTDRLFVLVSLWTHQNVRLALTNYSVF